MTLTVAQEFGGLGNLGAAALEGDVFGSPSALESGAKQTLESGFKQTLEIPSLDLE